MKRFLLACALAVPFFAFASDAQAFQFGNWQVQGGARVWFRVRYNHGPGYGYGGGAGGLPQAGPWYLYWPMEAHFQTPAPGLSPYFPPPMTLPPGFGGSPAGHP